MESELKDRLDVLEKKVDAIYVSAEKTRKYFLGTIIVTVIAFLLPLVGLVFAVPSLMAAYGSLGAF